MLLRILHPRLLILTAMSLPAAACAANTTYADFSVVNLRDEQLVEELESAARGFGVELNRTMYLMSIRPEPAYVLTSSATAFTGSVNATYNAYVMPVGYGAAVSGSVSGRLNGAATTRYQYTDVRAAERLGNVIATAISQTRQQAYRRRAMEVLNEYNRRVVVRRQETERTIQDFFSKNPELQDRRMLVAAVAPWAAAEGHSDGHTTLLRTKEIISQLRSGNDLTGTWYGMFAQTSTTADGQVFAFSEFVRIDLTQNGEVLRGSGVLGTGEVVELSGTMAQHDISAAVANTTSAINVRLTAIAAANQITGSFAGSGAGARMEGTFTLLR